MNKLWFVLSIIFIFMASMTANAGHHHRHAFKHEAKKYNPPPGPSVWCKEHPKKCTEYKTNDPWINDQVEFCIDSAGNRDGKVSDWERKQFADICR
jgi:hypothetical protein